MKSTKPRILRLLGPRWDMGVGISRQSFWQRIRPEQLFMASFVLLIVVGSLGLRLIPGMCTPGNQISWIDSVFTITSAVCVTGLAVVDTATFFTFWGQLWIMIFIQLGGLGVVVLSSVIILALGGRLSLRAESLSGGMGDVTPKLDKTKLIRDIVVFTFIIEIIGALALFSLWVVYLPWNEALWHAVFHSVSAFCNAGFSTFGNANLMDSQKSSATLLIIGTLIILGGLGFLSMEELYRQRKSGTGRPMRLSLHTKLVFWSTAILLVGGTIVYAMLEWTNPKTLGTIPVHDRITNAIFMSITPRTAGFNTIDYSQAHASTNFFTILLMSVGGSPGSTAGGLKTTTVALLVLLAWARFRRHSQVTVFSKTVPEETTQRAVGLFVFTFAIVTLCVLLMTVTENRGSEQDERLLPYMFEAVSAFNTVGLSMNVTPTLSDAGKVNAIFLMLLGRVGPLTFAAAIALSDTTNKKFRFAQENVVIG
jgi:trk system potassium uptake protein